MTERQILERFIAESDHDAFQALVELHGAMVLGVCRSILSKGHDVEDAFQSTFLILARSADTIQRRDTIGPWLHRVAFRVAKKARNSEYERRIRERRDAKSEVNPASDGHDPTLLPVIREEVSRLPEHYRVPLELCYLEGKTNEEAATQLRCPLGTVKGRLSRARSRLRDRLCRRGLTLYQAT